MNTFILWEGVSTIVGQQTQSLNIFFLLAVNALSEELLQELGAELGVYHWQKLQICHHTFPGMYLMMFVSDFNKFMSAGGIVPITCD